MNDPCWRYLIRRAGAPVAALVLACVVGCGRAASDDGPALVEVVKVEGDHVALTLRGQAVNQVPEGYRSPLRRLPIEDLVPDGARVTRGQTLFKVNRSAVRHRARYRERRIRTSRARIDVTRAEAGRKSEELQGQRDDLERQERVIEARIAATRDRDEQELAVARHKVQAARRKVDEAQARLARVSRLADEGVMARRLVEEARDEHERAVQALRGPSDHLDYLESITGAVSRALLEIERAGVRIDLGTPEQRKGVFGALAAMQRRAEVDEILNDRTLQYHERRMKLQERVLADSALRAESDGIVRHRSGLAEGSRSGGASAMFVLREENMGFTFDLPVRWRNLLSVAGAAQDIGVRVDVPQLRLRGREGRISSVSAMAHDTPAGQVYHCRVELSRPIDGLLEGMHVSCAISVPVPPDARVVPAWCVNDAGDPFVMLPDGRRQAISGRRIGNRFVVLDGLEPGQRIRARPDMASARTLRFDGVIRAPRIVDLEVPWGTELVDMVDDGSFVRKGDVVAQLSFVRDDLADSRLDEADQVRQRGAAQYELARVEADIEVADALSAWRKAELAVRRLRLEHRVLRYASGLGEVDADAKSEIARIALRGAERELSDLGEGDESFTTSAQAVRGARLKVERSRLELARTELEAVASARHRDWIAVWERRVEQDEAEDEARALRDATRRSRMKRQIAVSRAESRRQMTEDEYRRQVRAARMITVRAPITGRVFHHYNSWNREHAQTLRIGDRLHNNMPFFMPKDDRRELRVEIPARYHGRIAVGDRLPVRISVLAGERLTGTVRAISRHLHRSAVMRRSEVETTAVGVPPRVFTVTIDLELSQEQAGRCLPGLTAWTEIDA